MTNDVRISSGCDESADKARVGVLEQQLAEARAEAHLSKWPKEAAQEYHALKAEVPALVAREASLRSALEAAVAAIDTGYFKHNFVSSGCRDRSGVVEWACASDCVACVAVAALAHTEGVPPRPVGQPEGESGASAVADALEAGRLVPSASTRGELERLRAWALDNAEGNAFAQQVAFYCDSHLAKLAHAVGVQPGPSRDTETGA